MLRGVYVGFAGVVVGEVSGEKFNKALLGVGVWGKEGRQVVRCRSGKERCDYSPG